MAQVLFELSQLQLDLLSDEWIDAIYDAEFLEFGELPSEYDSILESLEIHLFFQDTIRAIDSWLCNDVDSEEKSWSFLSQHIQHRKLLALLAYYIDYGSKNIFSKEHRSNALLASQLYYKLLAVPGYKAYNLYHSQLFAHSLVCLNFPKVLCENEDKYFNTKELTYEVNVLIKSLKIFVNDLRSIIDTLNLKPTDMNFEDIMANLLEFTGGSVANKLNIDKTILLHVSKTIYEIIDILIACDADRKPSAAALQLLFKCVLPKLVSASFDARSANNIVRVSYVTYSGILLTKYGKAALLGYNVLLQHLCYSLDGLERAEVRACRVSLVLGLMSMLPPKSHSKFVKWLLKLSTTSKIPHRQIALEMLAKLLSHETEVVELQRDLPGEPTASTSTAARDTPVDAMSIEDENNQEFPEAMENGEGAGGLLVARAHTVCHVELVRAVYERVHDAASALRSRALAVLADCVDSQHRPIRDAIEALNDSGEESRLMAVSARCVCDERAAVRRAAVALLHKLLSGRTTPAPALPKTDSRATSERNKNHGDDSGICSTPKAKGKGVRAEAKLNKSISNEANSGGGSGDEVSTERPPELDDIKNDNDSVDTDHPLHTSDYTILVGACRDASIVVRVCAITALGELAAQRPRRDTLDAFLCGPMHQLSDPETKVQELVVNQVRDLLISRLRKYEPGWQEDELPWMFLAGIIRHNMRRHLQKACTILQESSNCINHRLVELLSTQLGAAGRRRDLQCLVLLTSAARHVPYSDLDFLLNYYYSIDDAQDENCSSPEPEQSRDPRILAMLFELFTVWSRWATAEQRTTLRERLVRRLTYSNDMGCRTACVSLAAHLEPNNLQWATELMQISERRALAGGEVEEWVRAADLSLVAPAPPAPALLQLFLAALAAPPPDWSAAQHGACVAGAGRLCVRARGAAVATAPPLAALLRDAAAPLPARINALRALADICTRYTCIVEPLLEDVCGCLEAAAPAALRRCAVRAVTRLLLGGFLRLRAPLYYKYCALLADDDQGVREPVEYYVTCCLAADAIYHHLVDCVLYYNSDEFVCAAPLSSESRQLVYDVMLQRLTAVQRLNAQCRFAREVLARAAAAADEGELPAALRRALIDTVALLGGPRMRLPRRPQNTGGEADIDDLQERITTNIVSHKMKRTVAEVVVPGVLRLYARLREGGATDERGLLAASLVRLATDLLADYRAEIEELLENDEELVERVRQFQETAGLEPSFGNARNLVTASAPPDPETPRVARKRPRAHNPSPRKRALRI